MNIMSSKNKALEISDFGIDLLVFIMETTNENNILNFALNSEGTIHHSTNCEQRSSEVYAELSTEVY